VLEVVVGVAEGVPVPPEEGVRPQPDPVPVIRQGPGPRGYHLPRWTSPWQRQCLPWCSHSHRRMPGVLGVASV